MPGRSGTVRRFPAPPELARGLGPHGARCPLSSASAALAGLAVPGHRIRGLGVDLPGHPGDGPDRPPAAGSRPALPRGRRPARAGSAAAPGPGRAGGRPTPGALGGGRRVPPAVRRQWTGHRRRASCPLGPGRPAGRLRAAVGRRAAPRAGRAHRPPRAGRDGARLRRGGAARPARQPARRGTARRRAARGARRAVVGQRLPAVASRRAAPRALPVHRGPDVGRRRRS